MSMKPPLGGGGSGSGSGSNISCSSSSSSKRQKVAGDDITLKRQELEKAKDRLSLAEKTIQMWQDAVLKANDGVLEAAAGMREATVGSESERDYAKASSKMAIEVMERVRKERDLAKAVQKAAKAEVESLQKDLQMLEANEALKEQLLGPDASTYFRAVVALGAPSELVSCHGWWKAQSLSRNNNPLFLCFVPPEAQPVMPVELAEEVFSQFLVDAKQNVVDEHDCAFTESLCNLVGQELENEHAMANQFRTMLEAYLGDGFPVKSVNLNCHLTPSLFPTDACVFIGDRMVLLAELKLEPKTTLFQAMQYYSIYLANLLEEQRQKSFCPCFLIEFVGTCIRISGLVYFEKVACQPLTPFLHCYINVFDHSDMNTLCRAMRALRTGVRKLRSAAVARNKMLPYQLCLADLELQERIPNKLVFVVKELESGQRMVYKFSRQYGESVHRAWADQDLAPKLIGYSKGKDGWHAIKMEFLDPAEWKTVREWSNAKSQTAISRRQLQETITEALDRAHAIRIDGRKTAHGDTRSPNIMVREFNQDEGGPASFEVKFLDFDWSGIVGQTVYPNFMNMNLKWHQDVGPGKELHQEHDRHCLRAYSLH